MKTNLERIPTEGGMTERELAEIEARANAATKGRWSKMPLGGKYYGTKIANEFGGRLELWRFGHGDESPSAEELSLWGPGEFEACDSHYQTASDAADADFIAHARQDIPALIAEVRRLKHVIAAVGRGPG